jgi:hypothetical protein
MDKRIGPKTAQEKSRRYAEKNQLPFLERKGHGLFLLRWK